MLKKIKIEPETKRKYIDNLAQTYVAIREKCSVIQETNHKTEVTILNRMMIGSANKAEACHV